MGNRLFEFINSFAGKNDLLDAAGIFFAEYLGYLLILFLLILTLTDIRKYWKISAGALLAGALARYIPVSLIRSFFPVPRPFASQQVTQLIDRTNTPSFPSGHTSFFFALSFFLLIWKLEEHDPEIFNTGTIIFFLLSSSMIGLFRIYCGVHWPVDILGGVLVGYVAGWSVKKSIAVFARTNS